MPLYEYECGRCGEVFEALVRSADEERRCPRCGSGELRKLISTFSAHSTRADLPACAGRMPCCRAGTCDPTLCGRAG